MENRPNRKPNVARQSAEDCAICLDRIQGKKTLKCSHSFCSVCIESSFKRKPACPICNTFYGEHTGNQPEGTMTVTHSGECLPGYEGYGIIVIHYSFPAGIQGVSSSTHLWGNLEATLEQKLCCGVLWLPVSEVGEVWHTTSRGRFCVCVFNCLADISDLNNSIKGVFPLLLSSLLS